MRRVFPFRQIGGGDVLRLGDARRINEKRRQYPRQPRQLHRGLGGGGVGDRFGAEGAFQRVFQIQRRVRQGARRRQIEYFRPPDQHRVVRLGRLALIGQFQRGGARGGNQHVARGDIGAKARFRRQQRDAAQPDRPAMAQRIQRQRDAACGRVAAQNANSVMSGTWSEHCTQSRVASITRWPVARGARAGEAQTWSSRRPRSPSRQSFAR